MTSEVKTDAIYSYHPLPGARPADLGETAPNVNSERYNFDRIQMFVESVDFRGKTVLDVGCNSGWFAREIASIGANLVIGVDDASHPEMGEGLSYAAQLEKRDHLGINYVDFRCRGSNIRQLFEYLHLERIDIALVLSVLHHIPEPNQFMRALADRVDGALIYEHHEFWPLIHDDAGNLLPELPQGHRFGWDRDLSWKRKMGSLESHENAVVEYFSDSMNSQLIASDQYKEIRLLGFSEKRRPLLLLKK